MGDPYYSCCAPDSPASAWYQQSNRAQIALWESMLGPFREAVDCEGFCDELGAECGLSGRAVEENMVAMDVLSQLPLLRAHCKALNHLCMRRLCAIARGCLGAPDEVLGAIDSQLVAYLTPRTQCQLLPSPRAIYNKVRQLVDALTPPPEPEQPEPQKPTVDFATTTDDRTVVTAEMSVAEGTRVFVALRRLAKARSCTMGEALLALIEEKVSFTCVLNFFGTDGPQYLLGHGELTRAQQDYWARRIDRSRDLTNVGTYLSSLHDAPDALSTATLLRDGHCRYPDCTRKHGVQLHHVIAFEQGGPTTLSNLVALCPHHHNKVTFEHVRLHMRHSGVCHWHFPNGKQLVTEPQGPLGDPRKVRWAQDTAGRIRNKADYLNKRRRMPSRVR